MNLLPIRNASCATLATALLCCLTALAQEASLKLVELPAAAKHLAATAESTADGPAAAAGAEEVVVQGRSMAFLRERVTIAEDKLYSVYNDLNTIDEFDIHCRAHAQTGTRIPQRLCHANFQQELNADKGQAVLAAMRGEAFGTDWQSAESETLYKAEQLQQHMQRLALENPELLEAMRELYEAMEAAAPRRYGPDRER